MPLAVSRYNSYIGYFRKTYGERLQKVVVDAGFTCPNRDGLVGTGGCTYCDNAAFHPGYSTAGIPIHEQIDEGIKFHRVRYRKAEKFLAYFQPYSNTYAPLDRLRTLYQEALSHPLVAGIVIGTRPDCVDEEKLDWLASLARSHVVVIEYGIESVYDRTLRRINRGHTFEDALRAVEMTAARGLTQGAHFIFGLPGESVEDMLAYAPIINSMPLHSVKFHQLQIVRGTAMEREFASHPSDFVTFCASPGKSRPVSSTPPPGGCSAIPSSSGCSSSGWSSAIPFRDAFTNKKTDSRFCESVFSIMRVLDTLTCVRLCHRRGGDLFRGRLHGHGHRGRRRWNLR